MLSQRSLATIVQWLCGMMVVWILVLPASWLLAVLPDHLTHAWGHAKAFAAIGPVPGDVVLKYQGQPAVVLLHHLPCAGWCLAVGMQLSEKLRSTRPRLHKATGTLVMVFAALLMAGVAVMEKRGMYFSYAPQVVLTLRGVGAWFLFTILAAGAAAVRGHREAHYRWVMRHIAAGIWVAVQRLLVGAAIPLTMLGLLRFEDEADRTAGFAACSMIAFILCCLVCEIHLASRHRSSRLYQAGQDSDGRQPGSHVQAPNEEVLRSSWKSKAA